MANRRQTPIIKDRQTGKLKEKSLIMSDIPESDNDTYVQSNSLVTLDKLADQYYNDASLWWIIARANGMTSMVPTEGKVLRIPANPNITYENE